MSDENSTVKTGFLAGLKDWAAELRSPYLFFLVGGIFLADFFVPDLLPFIDELVLFVLTVLLGRWKDRRRKPQPVEAEKPPTKTVTDRPTRPRD